jgi:predicted negative regulator of RcsB-dependent stress response
MLGDTAVAVHPDPAMALDAAERDLQNRLDDALATLNAVQPGAFAGRYAEVRGDALLAKGDRNGALKAYREAQSAQAVQAAAAGATGAGSDLLALKINALTRS